MIIKSFELSQQSKQKKHETERNENFAQVLSALSV